MIRIILDTNFLMIPGQHMVDVFSEFERVMHEPYVLVVLDKSINELEKLAQGNSKDAKAARLGLALVNAKKADNPTFWQKLVGLVPTDKAQIQIVKTKDGYADAAILTLADSETIVATLDAALKKKLKKKKVRIASLAQKKHIKIQ